MGDDFRAHREYQSQRKADRAEKFQKAFAWIRKEAKAIGWILNGFGLEEGWTFEHDRGGTVRWWPQSGKTQTGDYFGTWPELKAYLASLAREAS